MPRSASLPLRSLSLSLSLPLALAACTEDPGPTTTELTVETGEPPARVAYRENDTFSWKHVPVDGAHAFSLEVSGPYHVVVVCENRDGLVHIAWYSRTPDDATRIDHRCDSAEDPYLVRGTVVQSGEVGLGASSMVGEGPDWPFELAAAGGAAELVMRSSHEIAIRRDLQIAGDMQLGSIDLSQVGLAALVPTTFTAANADPAELRSSMALLDTGGTTTLLSSDTGWSRDLAPESALRPTDEQRVLLAASEPPSAATPLRHSRSVVRSFRVGAPTEVALPERLAGRFIEASAGRAVATWGSAAPAFDAVVLSRSAVAATGPRSWLHERVTSRSYFEATGDNATSLDLSTLHPFEAAWEPDRAVAQTLSLVLRRGPADGDHESSSVSQGFGPEVGPAAAR